MKDAKPEFKWTIMVYLAGDNNLTTECVYSLTEMKKVDTGDRVKVTAQFDPRGTKVPVHRYVINRRGAARGTATAAAEKPRRERIADDVTPVTAGTKRYPFQVTGSARQAAAAAAAASTADTGEVKEVYTGDPKTLFDFISWSMEHYKAEKYMVVLAGHGGGTEEDFLLKDENPRGSLSIPDLQRVFRAVYEVFERKIDVLGMDVCLMSMGEVCYQLRGLVDYIVGAEGYSATAGWPYGSILGRLDESLREGREIDPLALGRLIVDEYTNYYSEYMVGGFSADMSVIDLSRESMEALSESVKYLTELLNRELQKGVALKERTGSSEFLDQVILAHWEAQSYNGERFADLYDFCDLLQERYAAKELTDSASEEEKADNDDRIRLGAALATVKNVIKERVVKLSCFSGIDYQFSNGISVYFPWSLVGRHYKKIQFATASGWNDFLENYTKATRRNPRGHVPGGRKLWLNVERFRTGEDRTGEDRGEPHPLYGNPVYSMRNPPLVPPAEAGQSECLREQTPEIESLDISFFQ